MAGIGEAAAIIAIAQTGFALSSKLGDFLADYKAAQDVIESLREELEITSSTLQNLGELAEQNGLRNQKGVADTKRLTDRCNKTVSDIKTILKLEDDTPGSTSSSQETEMTRLDRMKVAFSKGKVDVPRADLRRLKVDMMLLYFSLMTFKARTKEHQEHYRNKIPDLKKELRLANTKYEETLNRANEVGISDTTTRGREESHRQFSEDFDRRDVVDYRQFLQRRADERKEKRLQEALALQQKEEDQKRQEVEKRVKEIGDAAILQYKSQIKEQEETAEREGKQFKDGLQRLLMEAGVEDDKIDRALKQMEHPDHAKLALPKIVDLSVPAQAVPEEGQAPAAKPEEKSIFSRMFPRGQKDRDDGITTSSDQAALAGPLPKTEEGRNNLEAWVLSHSTNSVRNAPISEQVLLQLFAAQKSRKKEKSLLERFALLDAHYQNEIVRLCRDRYSESGSFWILVYLNEMRDRKKTGRWRRAKGFTHIQIVLVQQRDEAETETDDLSTHSLDQIGNIPPPASNLGPTKSLLKSDIDGSRDAESRRQASPSRTRDTVPELVINHTHRHSGGLEANRERVLEYYCDTDHNGSSNNLLFAEVVEELLCDTTGAEIWTPVKTNLFKDAIDISVVRDSGYEFVENGNRIVISTGLSDSELFRLHERTKCNRLDPDVKYGRGVRTSGDRTVQNRHVAWDVSQSPLVDSHDSSFPSGRTRKDWLAYRGPNRRTFSHPGETRFFGSTRRSLSPPVVPVGNESVNYDGLIPPARKSLGWKHESDNLPRCYERHDSIPERSMVRFSSQPGVRPDNSVFLPERTESPHEYSDYEHHSQHPSRQSIGRGRRRSPAGEYEWTHASHSRTGREPLKPVRGFSSTAVADYGVGRRRSRERLRTPSHSERQFYDKDRRRIRVQTTGDTYLSSRSADAGEVRIWRADLVRGRPYLDETVHGFPNPQRRKRERLHDPGNLRRGISFVADAETTSDDEMRRIVESKKYKSSIDEEVGKPFTRDEGADATDATDEDRPPERIIEEQLALYGSTESLQRIVDVTTEAEADDSQKIVSDLGSPLSVDAGQDDGDHSGKPGDEEACTDEGKIAPVVAATDATTTPLLASPPSAAAGQDDGDQSEKLGDEETYADEGGIAPVVTANEATTTPILESLPSAAAGQEHEDRPGNLGDGEACANQSETPTVGTANDTTTNPILGSLRQLLIGNWFRK